MPYSKPSDAPDHVPADKKKQWIDIWNSAYKKALKDGLSKDEAESKAFAEANGVIKKESNMSTPRMEYRIFSSEVRAAKSDKPAIRGLAAVFGQVTDLGWVKEKVRAGAFQKAITDKQDVRCLFNHNPDNVLGRTKSGTLALEETKEGLQYNCDMPDTTVGRDVHEMIRRGDVSQSSFGFIVREDAVTYDDNGMATREIVRADLFDVSPVTYPAYPTTSVEARSNDAVRSDPRFKKRSADAGLDAGPMPHNAQDGGSDTDTDSDIDGEAMPHECQCDCRACMSAECEECDMHMATCGDSANCMGSHGTGAGVYAESNSSKLTKEQRAAKTKRVAGEDLGPGAFAYVGDENDTSTWKLPIKFSTDAKTKSHIQNALARFNQTKGIPAGEKAKVKAKILAAAKAHGIHAAENEKNSAPLSLELAKVRTRQLQIEASL